MGNKTLTSLTLGLILLLSALAIIPITPAHAGTVGTITVSSERFYGADIDIDGDGDSEAGEALLQVTITDPDIAAANASMPLVKANGITLTLYQMVGGSWVCWIYNSNKADWDDVIPNSTEDTDVILATPPPQETTGPDVVAHIGEAVNGIPLNSGDTVTIEYFDMDPVTTVTVEVTYAPTDATISLDRSEYPLNSVVRVTVEDPDLNFDPTTADVIADKNDPDGGADNVDETDITNVGVGQVAWYSTSDTTDNEKYSSDFKETGGTTGVFKTTFNMGHALGWFGEELLDVITVAYNDDGTARSTFATVKSYVGEISLDKAEYAISDKAVITLVEPDLNLDSTEKDSYYKAAAPWDGYVTVKSKDDSERGVKITETGANTGVFEGKFKFSFTGGADGPEPTVMVGTSGPQDITVTYYDTHPDVDRSATSDFITHTGEVSTDRDTYGPGMKAKVTITDPDLNTSAASPQRIDYTVSTVKVYSTADAIGTGITVLETGANTGVFEGKFGFTTDTTVGTEPGDEPKILVKATGDTVTVEYTDKFDSAGNKDVSIKKDVLYRTNTGSIAFEKAAYAPSQKVTIVLTDPDLNLDIYTVEYVDVDYDAAAKTWGLWVSTTPGAKTTAIKTDYTSPPVFISSSTWTAGWPKTTTGVISLKETDINTGIFKLTTPDLATLSKNDAPNDVKIGDTLYVKYIDAANDVGAVATLTGSASVRTNTAILELDKTEVKVGEKVEVTLTDPDKNIDPASKDTVELTNGLVSSKETDSITLTETGKDTGVFKEKFTVKKTSTGANDKQLQVVKGETVTVKYTDDFGAGGATNIKLSKTVKVYSADGSVSFDKDTYSPIAKAKITIEDPDANEDALSVDTIPATRVRVYSTTDPSGITVSASETDINTGVFTVTITLKDSGTSDAVAKELRVSNGDSIVVTYTEEADAAGTADVLRMDTATTWYTTATLAFDSATYTMEETATVTLTEPDKNQNPAIKETVNVTVYSTSDPAGIVLSLLETDVNTGIFKGSMTFTTGASTGSILKAAEGDTITATYTDSTPYEAPEVSAKKITATATIGVAAPPLPITAGTPATLDPTTGEAVTPVAGKPVLVSTELKNTATVDQPMLYIVQIKDATGRVVSMSFISGTVPAGKAFTFGLQWTPAEAGDYKVEVFAWKSWTEPTPLSEMVSQPITVTSS